MTTIYFDLDGTLTDPKLGITRSIQYALSKLDRPPPPEDELTWCIGPPLRASLKKRLGTDDLAGRALSLYRERFLSVMRPVSSRIPSDEFVGFGPISRVEGGFRTGFKG